MVWHIFRKDVRLLWQMVVGAIALYVLRLVVVARNPDGTRLSALMAAVCFLAAALLVVAVVHNDAIPGLRQDWLVRPIRRRDLLLSKLLFVVLLIQVPVFIADFCNGLVAGFPVGLALSASFAPNLRMLVVFLMPMLAFATLTRNLVETFAGTLGIALVVGLFLTSVIGGADLNNSSLWWIAGTIAAIFGLLGASVILSLQFYRRKTIPSRFVSGLTILVVLAVELLPWKPAFAIQQQLSAQPSIGDGVQIDLGKAIMVYQRGMLANVDIPTKFKGIGPDETLMDDRIDARVVDNGTVVPLGRTTFDGHSLSYDDRFQVMTIPRGVLKSATAQLEFDYSLTLFRITAHEYLPMNASMTLNGMGVCTTSANILLVAGVDCRFGRVPTLTKWSLPGVSFEVGRMAQSTWLEDYSPWFGRGFTSRRARFPLVIRQRDDDSARQRAAAELNAARLEMRAYEPVAHFKRHISIPVSQIAP